MLEDLFELFRKKSIYSKLRSFSILIFIMYFLNSFIAMTVLGRIFIGENVGINDLFNIIDSGVSTSLTIASVLISILISYVFEYWFAIDLFKSKKIKEKIKILVKWKFKKEFQEYYVGIDRVELNLILSEYKILTPQHIDFIIKRYESKQFIRNTNPGTIFAVVSLAISAISFIIGSQIENIDMRAAILLIVLVLIFLVPFITWSFNGFSKSRFAKFKTKEYFINLLTEEYFNRQNVSTNSFNSISKIKYGVEYESSKYSFDSINSIARFFEIKSRGRLYRELSKEKRILFYYKKRKFLIIKT